MNRLLRLSGRNRSLAINIVGNFFARAVNFGSMLVVVPVAITGLGKTQYGILAVLLSAQVFFYYADFGLGLALVNRLSLSERDKNWSGIDLVMSRVWAVLVLVAAVTALVGCAIILGWAGLVHLQGKKTFDDWSVWLVLVACIAGGFPASISQRVLFALQRNFDASLWMAVGRICSVAGVLIARRSHAGLEAYVFALIGLPSVVNWIATGYLFRVLRRDLCPRMVPLRFRDIRSDMKAGLQFTAQTVAVFTQTGIDNVLVGAALGAAAVAGYDVLFRMFFYIPALCAVATFPLWPALRHAISEGDSGWVQRTSRRGYGFVVGVSAICSALLVLHYREFAAAWTGLVLPDQLALALAWASYSVLMCISTLQNMILNAQGIVAYQAKMQVLFVAIMLPMKATCLVFWGTAPMVWTTVCVMLLQVVLFERESRRWWREVHHPDDVAVPDAIV